MRIMLFNTLYTPNFVGGAELSVQYLAETFVRMGHQVTVVSLSQRDNVENCVNGVKVYYIPLKNLFWPFENVKTSRVQRMAWHWIDTANLAMMSLVAPIIHNHAPHVVHTNNIRGFSPYIWRLLRRFDIPIVHTIRDYYLLCPRTGMFKNGENCNGQCTSCKSFTFPRKILSNNVSAVVGVSKRALDIHIKAGYFSKVQNSHSIFNSFERGGPPTTGRRTGGTFRVGFMGRLEPAKGIESLLRALSHDLIRNLEVWVAGSGNEEYTNYLKNEYGMLNIKFLGKVIPDEFFPHIDLTVFPSLWQEPLGRVVLESYTYGVPVIGTNIGGIPEIIRQGHTGFVFNPHHDEKLNEIIRGVMTSPTQLDEMRKNCFEYANSFRHTVIANQYLEVYNKIIQSEVISV